MSEEALCAINCNGSRRAGEPASDGDPACQEAKGREQLATMLAGQQG